MDKLTIKFQARQYARHFKRSPSPKSVSAFLYEREQKLLSKFLYVDREEKTQGHLNAEKEYNFISENNEAIRLAAYDAVKR